MTTNRTIVQADSLVKRYRGRAVVKNVSLTVNRNEIVGLLGPNGAGKTTTFYMIVGLIRADEGAVWLNGENVTRFPMYKRSRLGMGYLSQEPSIFRKLTVEQNVMAVLETRSMSKAARRARCEGLLSDLGIDKVARQKAYTLSGGERRKLEITRALAIDPELIMLDEPFSGVDPLAVFDIQSIIKSLRDQGLGIMITDHSVRETLEIVDRAYLLYEGEMMREGTSSFLIADKMSRELYLGHRFAM